MTSTVFVSREVVHQPVVDWVRDVQHSHLTKQSVVAKSDKSFAEIRPNNYIKWIGDNRSVIDGRIATMAAVVEPIERKAYWSLKDSVVGGARIAGYRNSLTMMRSNVLQRIGVMEIDR